MTLVLGAGIAGLVAAFVRHMRGDRELRIVGEVLGGAFVARAPLGPRYLHATPAATAFLDIAGLVPGPLRTVTSGTYGTDRLSYIVKTRGLGYLDPSEQALSPVHDVFETPTLMTVVEQLLIILRPYLVNARVTKIGQGYCETNSGEVFEFERLVTTLPVPEYLKLLVGSPAPQLLFGSYHAVPVTFAYFTLTAWPYGDVDYVYIFDPERLYSRVSRVIGADGRPYLCAEYAGALADGVGTLPVAFPDLPELRIPEWVASSKYGRILSRPVQYQAGTRGVGRFGQWQDWMLSHHVIEQELLRSEA